MIYLDNAATGGFKISAVTEIVNTVIKYLNANPGRSGHKLSTTGAELICSAREVIADTFGATPERVIFTKNCTEALNTLLLGYEYTRPKIITSVYEHNSVLRPLNFIKSNNKIKVEFIAPTSDDFCSTIVNKLTDDVGVVVLSAVSNVTGYTLPFREIARECKKRDIKIFIDGAQAGGHLPISLKDDEISALCLAGHKGLYGIMGTGVLILGDDINVSPLTFGGTGTESLNELSPNNYPEKLEAGTLNLPGIASLLEGVKYVKKNVKNFGELLVSFTKRTIEELNKIQGVKCFSNKNPAGIVAFEIEGVSSFDAENIYNEEFDIALRGGLHCAPLLHKYLNTLENGLIRVSFSPQNTSQEISAFISATKKIAQRYQN